MHRVTTHWMLTPQHLTEYDVALPPRTPQASCCGGSYAPALGLLPPLQSGLACLPNSPAMVILYTCFLVEVQGSLQSGFVQLQVRKQ